MIVETIEKRRIVGVLGAHEAPASFHWEAVRFLKDDATGADVAPPQAVAIPATREEIDAHFHAACARQLYDIATDGEIRRQQGETIKALKERIKEMAGQLAAIAAE